MTMLGHLLSIHLFVRHNGARRPLAIKDVSEALMYDALKSVLGLPAPLLKETIMVLSHQKKK